MSARLKSIVRRLWLATRTFLLIVIGVPIVCAVLNGTWEVLHYLYFLVGSGLDDRLAAHRFNFYYSIECNNCPAANPADQANLYFGQLLMGVVIGSVGAIWALIRPTPISDADRIALLDELSEKRHK